MSERDDQSSLFPDGPGAGRLDLPDLWLERTGPERDVVVSSRMRLARNVAGFHFKPKLDTGEGQRLEAYLHAVLGEVEPSLRYHALHEISSQQRDVMFERHLVSREHVADDQPRAVAFDGTGTVSVMVNEEDHLRLQVFAPGLDLAQLATRVRELDGRIAQRVSYCFDEHYGYLTSCPTNTGTGMRVSVMLHLPALAFRPDVRGARGGERDVVRMHNAAQQLGLTVRGLFGESSRAEGDFFQISNQVTLGRTVEQTVKDVGELVQLVLDWERRSRDTHLRTNRNRLEDHVWRSWALLLHARRMASSEALGHLSALRLGVCLGIIDRVSVGTLQGLMVTMRPGHLQHLAGRELGPDERDIVRAARIREALASN